MSTEEKTKSQSRHHGHQSSRKQKMKATKDILAISCLSNYIVFYLIHGFVREITGNELNILFAIAFHISILLASIYFKITTESKWVKGFSVYGIIFTIVSFGSFILMGVFYNMPYFYYKAALILSVLIIAIIYAIKKIKKWFLYYRNLSKI